MLLRPVSSRPPPPHLPRRSAAPSTTSPFFLILRRRHLRRRHQRPFQPVVRASLADILASLPLPSFSLVGPVAVAAAAALASSFLSFSSSSSSSFSRSSLPPPSSSQDPADKEYAACGDVAGEWILFTSPTPFNRCVLLRCPSVSFEDGGMLLDGLNERLLTEEQHYVNLSRGRIPAARCGDGNCDISYQRICVPMEDGGVIALDWPDNLDLEKEYGLDSTVVIVPGTPEGSMENSIKMFVLDALKNGYFPIVMNPRGCGGSPLTTPRLFTAADSDDVSTAVRFINSKRSWTTLMGVGWGYGANMLTKYLVEVGESTPLTAAVCIDNPFDLQDATRSFPHHIALDQKLMAGLVDILSANKELFQGKIKDFNVQKALSASCLRDFDGAISMVSHGFDTLDDFYSETSTRQLVPHVKIPLLFIQSDDGTVPLHSVPRSSISENPFTSLLLCSCIHSATVSSLRYTVLWCQNLALEWLSAVEFAFLKGRHPLIKDVDITINPSKGLAHVEPQTNDRKASKNKNYHQQSELLLYNNGPHGINGLLIDSAKTYSGTQNKENGQLKYIGDIDKVNRDPDEEGSEESSEDVEKGQVLQSASVVMNMLDSTMPGILDDDQKEKVLVAVEQGESLAKALEEAVPEDVRGKLTTSVAEILQSKREYFSLDSLKGLGWNNVRSTTTKTVTQEKHKDSVQENVLKDAKTVDQNSSSATIGDGDRKNTDMTNNNSTGESIESLQGKPSQASEPIGTATEMGNAQNHPNNPEKTSTRTSDNSEEQHRTEQGNETTQKQVSDDQSVSNSNGAISERMQSGDATSDHNPQSHAVEKEGETIRTSDDKSGHNVNDQSMQVSKIEESKPSQSNVATSDHNSQSHAVEKEGETVRKSEDKSAQSMQVSKSEEPKPSSSDVTQALDALTKFGDSTQKSEDNSAQNMQVSKPEEHKPSSSNVTQALDALTKFDDSTQMAVNNVFGVLESMIDQYEKQQDSEDGENPKENADGPSLDETESHMGEDMDNASRGEEISPSSQQANNNSSVDETVSHVGEDMDNATRGEEISPSSQQANNSSSVDETESHVGEDMDNASKGEEISPSAQQANNNSSGIGHSLMSKDDCAFVDEPSNLSIVSSVKGKMRHHRGNGGYGADHVAADDIKVGCLPNYLSDIAVNSYLKAQYEMYLDKFLSRKLQLEAPESNSATDLFLDPQEGKWKIADQMDSAQKDIPKSGKHSGSMEAIKYAGSSQQPPRTGNVIEPHYFTLGQVPGPTFKSNEWNDTLATRFKPDGALRETLICSVRNGISSALKVEVSRKLGITDTTQLERSLADDVEWVADQVCKIIMLDCEICVEGNTTTVKFGATHGNDIVEAVSTAVEQSHLRNILPVGVIVGVTLASLRNYHVGVTKHDDHLRAIVESDILSEDLMVHDSCKTNVEDNGKANTEHQKEKIRSQHQGAMIGAVTAALSASALVVRHQEENDNLEETAEEKNQNNFVSSFAEKALSVAAPVVPTKSDGEVDHDRLVAVLAELGQKGGVLRFVAKIALLWGGIRGATSLTNKLISFLRISERPLFQRIMGFSFMVLVLWSPVVIPLLPTLVQSWTISSSTGIVGYACIVGLYVSITILVMLWGKRIRGYENPVEQYGMNIRSASGVREFFLGLVGGIAVVGLVHSISILLGFATLRPWPGLSSFLDRPFGLIKYSSNVLMLALRGFVTATSISVVEEMVFRSWLPEEIAVDLGYYNAILISGVAFSLIHRSLPSIPGFLLLSLVLFGLKQRTQGKLAAPIGLRSGIMTASYLIQSRGFITFKPGTPFWLTSTYHLHPFDGVIGLSICSLLAIIFFPQKPVQKDASV